MLFDHLFVNIPTTFWGMTVTFCRRSWRSCERPSSSCERCPYHQCAPAPEEVWVFLGSFWPEMATLNKSWKPDRKHNISRTENIGPPKLWSRSSTRLDTFVITTSYISWGTRKPKLSWMFCLKVLDCYQPLKGPCRWNNQFFYSLLFDGWITPYMEHDSL